MTDGPIHFFVHVPKCAGTTVERHLEAHLGPDEFALAPRWKHPLREALGNRAPLPEALLRHGRAMSGHSLQQGMAAQFPGRALREYVLLRDPVSQHVSFYNYRLRRTKERGQPHPGDFETWMKTQRRSPISRFLLMRYFGIGYPAIYRLSSRARFRFLEDKLSAFTFVGDYRRCNEALAGLSAELGIPEEVASRNVGAADDLPGAIRLSDLGAEARARIEARHALDALLHRRWADRGFAPGAPAGGEAAAMTLPDDDRGALFLADVDSLLRKRLGRLRGA